MLLIVLKRTKEYKNVLWTRKPSKPEDATIGTVELVKNGNVLYKCFSCENGGPSTDTAKQDKRIIARTYGLYETTSNVTLPKEYKPRCISLFTKNLPSFKDRRIHIHIGNAPQDTEGCLLFGTEDNKNGTISGSTVAVREVYDYCFKEGLENCALHIVEEFTE